MSMYGSKLCWGALQRGKTLARRAAKKQPKKREESLVSHTNQQGTPGLQLSKWQHAQPLSYTRSVAAAAYHLTALLVSHRPLKTKKKHAHPPFSSNHTPLCIFYSTPEPYFRGRHIMITTKTGPQASTQHNRPFLICLSYLLSYTHTTHGAYSIQSSHSQIPFSSLPPYSIHPSTPPHCIPHPSQPSNPSLSPILLPISLPHPTNYPTNPTSPPCRNPRPPPPPRARGASSRPAPSSRAPRRPSLATPPRARSAKHAPPEPPRRAPAEWTMSLQGDRARPRPRHRPRHRPRRRPRPGRRRRHRRPRRSR